MKKHKGVGVLRRKYNAGATGFPKDFIWGAAAASYQVEGAATADGKGLSVWDMFCRRPGNIVENQTGDVACDHYHRYAEDARRMGTMGLKAYRLSISWPRVLPDGIGKVNARGLAFYDRLVDALLAHGVEPWITLFHWDYPYALFCRGGWLNRDTADWFADYTRIVAQRLSDRVTHWFTLNEPSCFIQGGHWAAWAAPGLKLAWPDVIRAAHHALLAHGRAAQVIRAYARKKPVVGAAPVGTVSIPATSTRRDIDAARRHMFAMTEKSCSGNTWFIDPMIKGCYPADTVRAFGRDMPAFPDGDMDIIRQPLDFFGVNIYYGQVVRARGHVEAVAPLPAGHPQTAMEWQVTPAALYWGPRFFYERYQLPIIISENGMANCDWVARDGRVHDPQRIDFLARHLVELRRATRDGVKVRGYFHWSIMDNFEWSFGHQRRFGLVYVDYATQRRLWKDSAYWYQRLIATNGASLDDGEHPPPSCRS